MIKSAAGAASLHGGHASGRLDQGLFCAISGRASAQNIIKNSDNCSKNRPGPGLGPGPAKKDGKFKDAVEKHKHLQKNVKE